MAPIDVAIIGDINPDILLLDDQAEVQFGQAETLFDVGTLTVGGSGSITACACARLGLRTMLVGALGRDVYGDYMRSQLEQRGVDVSRSPVLEDAGTGFSVIVARRQDRAILTHCGAIGGLTVEHLPMDALTGARHVHISSYFLLAGLRPHLTDVVRELASHGVTVSLDTNWDPHERWGDGLSDLLPLVDVFLPNAAEALAITQTDDIERAGRELGEVVPTVAIKLGREGALLVHHRTVTRHAGFTTTDVDTTGAGDAFNAGFLRGLASGWTTSACIRLANAVAALSTQGVGGVATQPDLEAATALIADHA